MKYDFTTLPERRGHDALALDAIGKPDGFIPGAPKEGFSAIPMWVADMNFVAAPPIIEHMIDRLKYPTFGYFSDSDEYFESIIRWRRKRHGVELKKEWIGYENGVLGCLATALRAFTEKGEGVLLNGPTYVGFLGTLRATERRAVISKLVQDPHGIYRLDLADMEAKIKAENIRFAIFCSPYNPIGRVWEREEVVAVTELFKKYDITVFSDEIWSDILLDGHRFVPTASVSEDAASRTVTACAPSKTFNLAGLIGAYHIIPNPELRERMKKESDATHYNNMNVISQHALCGAYTPEGEEWADELCCVLSENVAHGWRRIRQLCPESKAYKPQGTYMLFIDFGEYLAKKGMTLDELLQAGWDVGVIWQDGRAFGGESSIRMNLALPFETVKEAFDRLEKYVFTDR